MFQTSSMWSARADSAESAVLARHLTPVWLVPGTALGVVGWPSATGERRFARWHYWWQAALLECMVEASRRESTAARTRHVRAVARGIQLRGRGSIDCEYLAATGVMGMALKHARDDDLVDCRKLVVGVGDDLRQIWRDRGGDGIPWRRDESEANSLSSITTALLMATRDELALAADIADRVYRKQRDPSTGLILRNDYVPGGVGRPSPLTHACAIALETALATRSPNSGHAERAVELLHTAEAEYVRNGVIRNFGGGDAGLISGAFLRCLLYLRMGLPATDERMNAARVTASEIISASAQAAWDTAVTVEGQVLFSADWTRSARMPDEFSPRGRMEGGEMLSSAVAERDLSVQLSGWLAVETAYRDAVTP